MKKIISLLLIIILMCGCSKNDEVTEISYDLSSLNDTMAYAQLINIIKEPDEYLDKGIKLKGLYTANFNGFTHDYNYTITIQDNTQCCAQGIEFILKNDKDYPEENSEITLIGVLDLFEEGKHSYCYIKDAIIEQD